jgi:chromosome segregation ATPase
MNARNDFRREADLKPVKTIEDLLREKNLTPEEYERHKQLIEECKVREAQINEYSQASRENIKKMSEELDRLTRSAGELWQAAEKLSQRVSGIYLQVAPAPAKKVYH